MPVTGFRFQIFSGSTFVGLKDPNRRIGSYGAFATGCFPLYINNSFTQVRQEIGDSYYSKNVFNKSLLSYQGGRVLFDKSNQVVQSDLLIGAKVRQDSDEVRQLQKDFHWHSIEF